MSIDREINARVEAYRNNPQALKDKYARNKELVDLLALQFIKSDLDKKKNSIAMMMNTNPATIKQQREQEVFSRTAEDVAQQLGGILQTAKNKKQMARRPAPQGLGALMPQQGQRPQQPQTRMMQAGGIVGFDGRDGSRVGGRLEESGRIESSLPERPSLLGDMATQEDIAELIRRGILPENFKGSLSAERAEEMLARPISQEPKTVDTTPSVEPKPPTSGKAEGIAAVAEQPKPEPKDVPSDTPLIFRDQQNVPAGTSVVPSGGGTAPAKPQEFDLETALEKVAPVEYTPVDRTGTDAVGIERLKRFGMDPESLKSPEDVGKEAYDTAYKQLGIEAKDAERRKGLEALAALDAAQTDPDRLRRDRLIRFLTAGAGRGNTALAAAGAASANLGMEQRRNIRARQIERNNMVKEIQDANTTLIQSAQARGDTATTRQANIVNNAMQALAQYDEAELAARRTDATNKMSASIANYERKMSEIELLAEQAQNRIQARIDRGDALRDVHNDARDQLEAVSEQFSTLQAEAIQNDAGVARIDQEIAKELQRSNPDQDRLKSLRERRVTEIERVRQEFVIAHPRLHDLRQSLVDTINQLGSQIQSTLSVGSGVSTQQVDDAVQRQLQKQKGIPPYLQPYNP